MTSRSERHAACGAPDQPRGWLQPFLLLALRRSHSYGYEMMQQLKVAGFAVTDHGSIYRTLRQLEGDGLVRSHWDPHHAGPARRVYSLTEAGRSALEAWSEALRDYHQMLASFFSVYESSNPGGAPTAPEGIE